MQTKNLKISTSTYELKPIWGTFDFLQQVESLVQIAADDQSRLLLLPEFLSLQLLSIASSRGSSRSFKEIDYYEQFYMDCFAGLAHKYGIHIVAGTHPIKHLQNNLPGKFFNTAFLFSPNGKIFSQPKIHPTPYERSDWQVDFADSLKIFDLDGFKIAILICYDIEFPELTRLAREAGADLILCPSCTASEHGFRRVRYCAHARAIENQMYVAVAGTVGTLAPKVEGMATNYGQAAILTPNDGSYPSSGVAIQGTINQQAVVSYSLDFSMLELIRLQGAVYNWNDRRPNLYPKMAIEHHVL